LEIASSGTQSGVRIKMEYPDIVGYIVGQYFVCGETKDSGIYKEDKEKRNRNILPKLVSSQKR